jgi:hypothetical protein
MIVRMVERTTSETFENLAEHPVDQGRSYTTSPEGLQPVCTDSVGYLQPVSDDALGARLRGARTPQEVADELTVK